MDSDDNSINVLALSGGGYRGLYSLRVLAELEDALCGRLVDHFKLFAGTSVGGLIALAICAGHSPCDLLKKFKQFGPKIFPPESSAKKKIARLKGTVSTIYGNGALRELTADLFKELTFADLKSAAVIVPAANLTTGRPRFFKSLHHKSLWADKNTLLREAALATAAAPVFLPVYYLESEQASFADGGLIGNAPGLFGTIEAITKLGYSLTDVRLLAVGTLGANLGAQDPPKQAPWFGYWLNPLNPRLISQLFAFQERQTHNMLKLLLGDRYEIIDSSISSDKSEQIELDDISPATTRILLGHAVNDAHNFTNTQFFRRTFQCQ